MTELSFMKPKHLLRLFELCLLIVWFVPLLFYGTSDYDGTYILYYLPFGVFWVIYFFLGFGKKIAIYSYSYFILSLLMFAVYAYMSTFYFAGDSFLYFYGLLGIISCVQAFLIAKVNNRSVLFLVYLAVLLLMTLLVLGPIAGLLIETFGEHYTKYLEPITKISHYNAEAFIGIGGAFILSLIVAKKLWSRRYSGLLSVKQYTPNKIFFWLAISSAVFWSVHFISYFILD